MSRKWAKKKFGYGWVTVTTKTYTCVQDKCGKKPSESGLGETLCIPDNGKELSGNNQAGVISN